MKALEYLQENVDQSNIPREWYELEIAEMMEDYALYAQQQPSEQPQDVDARFTAQKTPNEYFEEVKSAFGAYEESQDVEAMALEAYPDKKLNDYKHPIQKTVDELMYEIEQDEVLRQREAYKAGFNAHNTKGWVSVGDAEFLWSLMPEWIKSQPIGLDPTMYGTLTKKGDEQVSKRVRDILQIPQPPKD